MFSKKWRAKVWKTPPIDAALVERIGRELPCSMILASLLLNRGVTTPEEAGRFLQPKLGHLADPVLLPGIDAAVARIVRAVQEQESIAIFGDYDVDGFSSTALLLQFFNFIGKPIRHYIPKREEEGYGMNEM